MDDKPLGIFTGLEAICQPADGMGLPLAVTLPCDLRPSRPLLVARIERREGDDEPVVVVEVRHCEIINTESQDCQSYQSEINLPPA
jgi:hypothetical protein